MSDTLSSPQLLYVVVFGLMCSPIHRSISASDIVGLLLIASSPTALVILKVRPVLVIRKPVAGCIYDPTAMISDHWQNDALMGFEIPDRWASACAEHVRGRQDAPRQNSEALCAAQS